MVFQDDDVSEDEVSEYDEEKAESKRDENNYKGVDNEYEGELGYSLIKSLRGSSVGRRFKRNLFKYGFFQIFCGFALSVITITEGRSFNLNYYYGYYSLLHHLANNYPGLNYFSYSKYGSSLQVCFLISFISITLILYCY